MSYDDNICDTLEAANIAVSKAMAIPWETDTQHLMSIRLLEAAQLSMLMAIETHLDKLIEEKE